MKQKFVTEDYEFSALCENLAKALKTYLGEVCIGFYVFGSSVVGDFRITSDIDFICFLNKPIDNELLDKIINIHNNVKANKYGKLLEGEYHYLTYGRYSERKIVEVHKGQSPFIDSGTIDPDVVEMIKRGGLKIYGEEPQYVLPYFTTEDIKIYYRRYLEDCYKRISDDEVEPVVYWSVLLNACRAYYCIINENFISSKEIASIWVGEKFPEYKKIIETANKARNGMKNLLFSKSDAFQIRYLLHSMLDNPGNPTGKEGFLVPMRTEIQVNTVCNCQCPHCGYDTVTQHQVAEMTLPTIIAYLNETKECWGWIDRVLFEGGEATLSMDKLIQCLNHAKLMNIPNIQLNTNLTNVSVDMCEELINAGCNYFEISVDAISQSGWQKMRGLDNFSKKDIWYNSFCNSLKYLCKRSGVQIDFNYTPTSINIEEIEEVYRFACEYGVSTFSFQNLICTSTKNKSILLSRDEVLDAISKCIMIAKQYTSPPTILICCSEPLQLIEHEYEQYQYVSFVHCDCGNQYIYINHKQELRKCCFGCGGNIGVYKEGHFAELWNNRICSTGCMFV